MSARTVVLTVPENLYERLEAQAQLADQPVDKLVLQNLSRNLPPTVEEDLPQARRAELAAMAYLSDDALWPIAQSNMNRDKVALYDVLLDRQATGDLTHEGRQWLTQLRDEEEAFMLRKAHAYALLKSRGHELPSLTELRAQTP